MEITKVFKVKSEVSNYKTDWVLLLRGHLSLEARDLPLQRRLLLSVGAHHRGEVHGSRALYFVSKFTNFKNYFLLARAFNEKKMKNII